MGESNDLIAWALGGAVLVAFFLLVRPALDSTRWKFAADLSLDSLIWGVLGVAVCVYLVGPFLAPILVFAIIVHEYGHVLAYRLAGHRAPKFRVVPFGGVAMSDEPARNQAENVFVALMGPAFSIAPLVATALLSRWLITTGDFAGAQYAHRAMLLIAGLNAFNLLPFFPLDGGRIVRAVAMTAGRSVAQGVTFVMSAAFGAFGFLLGEPVLIVFALLGLLAALQTGASDANTPAMSFPVTLLAVGAYGVSFAAHFWVVYPFLVSLLSRAGG